MAYYNEKLQELQNQVARRNQLESMLRSLRPQRDELAEKVSELESIKIDEQADVDKLEGRSLASFFYNVVGKMDEKLDKERQEAYAARVKYDAAARELEVVENDIKRTESELFSLQNCGKRYEELLKEKTASIKESGVPEADEIFQQEAKIAFLESQNKEIQEAISCANIAKYTAEDVLAKLESADSWGTWDLLGGGIIADAMKHSELDEAQDKVEKLQIQLRHLKTELADVTIQSNMQVNVDGFLRFADYFFDGLFADWAVLDQINQSMEQVVKTNHQIQDVLNKLESMQKDVKGDINLAKARIKELVNKVDM